jgi:DNA repair ATPase RecN
MVVHSCNLCGFSTQKKSNYDIHIRSKPHQLEQSKIEVSNLNKQLNDMKEIFETEKMRCNLLNERLISCEDMIKEKDVIIEQLTNENNVLQERLDIYLKNEEYLKENINMLKEIYDSSNELSKKYLESSNKLIDSTNVLSNKFIDSNSDTSKYLAMAIADSHKVLTNTTKVANKSIDAMKFIMENYNDAPNIEDIPIILTEEEMLSLEINPISGSTDIIKRVYIEGVEPKQRCTWCMDASRLKFTVKHKGQLVMADPYGKIMTSE